MKKYTLALVALIAAAAGAAGGAAQNRPAPRQSSNVCRVSAPSRGADLGALINECDRKLGAGEGVISVSGGGNLATRAVVSPRHTLLFGRGVYTASTPGSVIWLKDSSTLRCESRDAVLEESTAANVNHGIGADGTPVHTIVQDFAGGTRNGDASSAIHITGCHFRGARRDFNSAYQTVALGNCRDCSATGNYFEGTNTIALQVGGGSGYGHYARNVTLDGNEFRGVASQNLAVTNGAAVRVTNNRFYAPGKPNGPGVTVIDVEPNTNDVIDGLDIGHNLIDATDSPQDAGGWKTTNAIAVNAGNPTRKFAGVVVHDNTIIAGRRTDVGSRIGYSNILLRAGSGTVVRNNRMNHGSRCILLDTGTSDNLVEGNRIENCGSGSTYPINLQSGATRNRIVNNVLTADPGDAIGALLLNAPHRERSIVEESGADANLFSGNAGDVSLSGRRSRVEAPRGPAPQ
jgi:hypothetical protein